MFIIRYIKELYKAFKHCNKSQENRNLKKAMKEKQPEEHEFSLYGRFTTKEAAKTHSWVHYVFKYKIFAPIFYALEKGFKKYFYKPTDYWYDKIYNVWDKSFEEALYDWTKNYIGINKNWKEKDIKKYMNNCPVNRLFKLIQHGIIGNDSAYRELQNMLTVKLVNNFAREFKDNEINHLLYTTPKIYDMNYYHTGYDLLNRYFLQGKDGQMLLATKTVPTGHEKVYFTINTISGYKKIFAEMQQNVEKIPKNYVVTNISLNATGINNMVVEVFKNETREV